jgi:hypothetical protein
VYEAVEDGVGISRVAAAGVPFVDGNLAREDRRTAPITFLEDLVEVTPATGIERFEAPIVEDEELGVFSIYLEIMASARCKCVR